MKQRNRTDRADRRWYVLLVVVEESAARKLSSVSGVHIRRFLFVVCGHVTVPVRAGVPSGKLSSLLAHGTCMGLRVNPPDWRSWARTDRHQGPRETARNVIEYAS